MLASIRRQQKGILIVVTAIIIVAFAWLYNRMDYDQPGLTEVFSIDGRPYRASEAQKLMRSFDIVRSLGTFEFLIAMAGRQSQDRVNYAVNLLVLRKQSQELGIRPSEEQISEFIKELPSFQTGGRYDPEIFNRFTTDLLAPNGFSAIDLYQLIGDAISFSKIQELLAANLVPSPGVVDESFKERFTEFTVARVDLPEPVPPDAAIDDAAVKALYDKNKAQYLSAPKRRIEYVLFERPAPAEDEIEEVTKTKMKVYGETVAKFAREVLAEGADFAALAKKHGALLKKTEAFSASEPPEALKDTPELLSAVFRSNLEVPISDPIDTAKGYALFNLLAVIEPQPLSLEEATPRIRKSLQANADSIARRAANSAVREKLAAELKSGQPLIVAAAVAGLTASNLPAFSRDKPPADQPDASLLAGTAAELEKGELSDVLNGAAGPFLIYVKDKKPLGDDTVDAKKDQIGESLNRLESTLLFESWFQRARESSGVRFPAQVAAQ